MEKRWRTSSYSNAETSALISAGYTPLLAQVLSSRGVASAEAAEELLAGDISELKDPFILSDMDAAVERIAIAIERSEHVAVYGDYDVDGITSSALLGSFLRELGLECEIYVPDRFKDGYGVNKDAVKRLADKGVTLIVTVDCGITAFEETEYARSLGVDMIITDHHECRPELPKAVAVVNPKRDTDRYLTPLAGVGVAFKLACALSGSGSEELMVSKYADLAALGTVADVMPLVGENRILVRSGLKIMNTSPRPGVLSLLDERCRENGINARDISFSLAPRLNAAGRMDSALLSVSLMLAESKAEGDAYAAMLGELNTRRKELENAIFSAAKEMLKDFDGASPIVLAAEDWHQGVTGIVASRLSEKYNVPAVMISLKDGVGKGSCRSVPGFNIFEALGTCSDILITYGGHDLAAGLTVSEENVDELRSRLGAVYAGCSPEEKIPTLDLDFEITDTSVLTEAGVESLSVLEPFGSGNEEPAFCIRGVRIVSASAIGRDKNHMRLTVNAGGMSFGCVMFGHTPDEYGIKDGDRADIAFNVQINEFRGERAVQFKLRDVKKTDCDAIRKRFIEGGELTPGEALLIKITRSDCVPVWRAAVSGRNTFRLYSKEHLCVCAFNDIGLMEYTADGENITAVPDKTGKSGDLNSSETMKKLERLCGR